MQYKRGKGEKRERANYLTTTYNLLLLFALALLNTYKVITHTLSYLSSLLISD